MDETEIDLRGLIAVLRRQLRLIVLTVVVVVGIAGIWAFALTPIYSAASLILVDPSSKDLLDPESGFTSAGAYSARIDSEVEILRSDSILLRVIASQQLVADDEFGPTLGWQTRLLASLRLSDQQLPTGREALNDTLANLRQAVQVQRRSGTYLISAQVRSTNPDTAARLANAIAEAYIAEQVSYKVGSVLASRDILQARISQARESIVQSEDSFDAFIETNIARISSESGASSLATMQRQIDELVAVRQSNAALAATAQVNIEQADFQALVATLQSDALDALQAQRDEITAAIADADAGSPALFDLRGQLDRTNQTLLDQADIEVDNIEAELARSEQQEQQLREEMRTEVLSSSLSSDVLTELYGLQQRAEIARGQYQTLLSRAQDLDTQASLQVADSRVVSPALAPQSPAFPNRTLIILLAGLSGLALGIALAFLYENLIGGFTDEEQVESVLKTRFASAVPHQSLKGTATSFADLLIDEPLSNYAESIRRIRMAIDRPAFRNPGERTDHGTGVPDSGSRVVMVSSSAPNDGKSTIALALARSYALLGERTLLIDGDLRKPSQHRLLNLNPSEGLQEFLRAAPGDSKAIEHIMAGDPRLDSLTVVLGARHGDLPTDQLLSGAPFRQLVDAARKSFNVVVIDTPPVGPVLDALYIAPFADLVVFVARWAATSQTEAKRAIGALRGSKRPDAEVVAVLNQQNETRASYYKKYGGYYSGTS